MIVRIEWATANVALLRPIRRARCWYCALRYVCRVRPAAFGASVNAARSHLFPCPIPPLFRLPALSVIAGQIYVDKMLGTSAPAKPAARGFSSRRPAAAVTPVAETASDATPTRKRRPMTAKEKKAVSERMRAYWAERRKQAAK